MSQWRWFAGEQKRVLNVHADSASVPPPPPHQVRSPSPRSASSIITEAPSLMLGQLKKSFHVLLDTALQTAAHVRSEGIVTPQRSARVLRRRRTRRPRPANRTYYENAFLFIRWGKWQVARGAIHSAGHTARCIYLCKPGLCLCIRLI